MEPNLDRIKEIFRMALEQKTSAERASYLNEACHANPELRQELESLLQAHKQAGEFLNQTTQPPVSDFANERAGMMIGRYRLLELYPAKADSARSGWRSRRNRCAGESR